MRFNRATYGTNVVDTGISASPANFTWMGWVFLADNSTSGGKYDNCLVAKFGSGTGRMQTYIRGNIHCWFGGDGDSIPSEEAAGSTPLPVGVWTHVAIVKTPTTLRIYVNGRLDAEKTGASLGLLPEPNWTFGGYRHDDSYKCMCGMLSNVSLWDVAFSAGKIEAWKNAVPSGTERHLIGAWMLDDGPGDLARNAVDGAPAATPHAGSFLWQRYPDPELPEWTAAPADSGITIIFK
jgi:hypothetical protein